MGDFAALCREFVAEEYEAAPVTASGLGLTQFDGRLDDLSEAAFEERRRRSAAWRARFHLVGCSELLVIRERHLARVAGAGTAALRDFHDRLAGSGGLPPALAERALAGER